jgi:hypothetical protein
MLVAMAALGFVAAWLSSAAAEEVRTWVDSTGKYKIKAKLVQASEGQVTLEREDGTQVTIALNKLSEADRKYVAEMQSGDQDPFKAVKPAKKAAQKKKGAVMDADEEEEPAEKPIRKRKKVAEEPEEEEAGEVGGEPKAVTPRWSSAKEVLASPRGDKWSLSIEAPELPAAARKGRPIAIPAKTDFFEKLRGFAINPVCCRAVIGYVLDRPGFGGGPVGHPGRGGRPGAARAGGQTRIVLCDLQAGKMLAECHGPGKMVPLALSDAGNQVLMRRDEFGQGNQDRLELWSVSKSGITRELQWVPHDDQQHGGRDITWARFIDEERLATVSGGGMLTIWKASTAKPLYYLRIQGACRPAISPDGKYLAFATDKEIGVLDLAAGEVVAMQPAPKEHFPFPVFAFTPKGTRLVCASFDRIYVWDVATGALYRDIPLAGTQIHIGEHLLCPSEDHVFVGNSLLVDIESQAKVWTYQGHEEAGMLGPVCWFVVSAHNAAGALVPTALPHPAAQDRIQKAMQSPDFFVLKPGTTVILNVSGLQDPGEREKAAAALTQKLQANGCQVGPNGTIELVATTEMGQRREVAYHTFGMIGSRVYNVQEYISRLRFVYQGQTAWEVACGNVPGFISLKQGETVEEVLRRSERPNYAWFATVELPKTIQKPTPGASTLGNSKVTVVGVQ